MSGNNIIGKQVVSIDFQSKVEQPFAVQEQAIKWCNEVLAPAIEEALEPYSADAQIIRMDALVIDMPAQSDPFTPLLAQQIARALLQQIEAVREAAQPATLLSSEQSFEEAFIFFLGYGYLPWWYSSQSKNVFEHNAHLLASTLSDAGRRQLRHLLSGKMIARRMVMAVPHETLVLLLAAISGQEAAVPGRSLDQIKAWSQLVQNTASRRRFLLERTTDYVSALANSSPGPQLAALRWLLEGRPLHPTQHGALASLLQFWVHSFQMTVDGLLQALKNSWPVILPGKDIRKILMRPNLLPLQQPLTDVPVVNYAPITKGEAFYISNAGLILVAPFLPRFFTNLGMVADGVFNSRDLAVALMQYLVTGAEGYAEYDTVFAKLLCGMEPGEPIMVIPQLPDGFKSEAFLLLESIIGHWPVLKNTSVAGLQESFLQREGKLSQQGNVWLLQVSQKAYDMLLNDLPWTIHTVKLPWMDRPIRTEWV